MAEHPEFLDLLKRFHDIVASGAFPGFPLESVSALNPLPTAQQSRLGKELPCLIPQAECWTSAISADQVMCEFRRAAARTSPPFMLFKGSARLKDEDKSAAVNELLLGGLRGGAGRDPSELVVVCNVELRRSLWRMYPPHRIFPPETVFDRPEFPVHANVAPSGAVVDLHYDSNWHVVSQPLGDCKKIWVFYPPTNFNLDIYHSASPSTLRLEQCAGRLQDGILCETDSSQALYIPPGWLHATYTVCGGTLVGINFATLSGLSRMMSLAAGGLPYLNLHPGVQTGNFQVCATAMRGLLGQVDTAGLGEVQRAWETLRHSVRDQLPLLLKAGVTRDQLDGVRRLFTGSWDSARGPATTVNCAVCRRQVKHLERHMNGEDHDWGLAA